MHIVVQLSGIPLKVGHHVARVASAVSLLQARNHPPLVGPALCGVSEFANLTVLDASKLECILHGQLKELRDLLQPGIARQAHDLMHNGK